MSAAALVIRIRISARIMRQNQAWKRNMALRETQIHRHFLTLADLSLLTLESIAKRYSNKGKLQLWELFWSTTGGLSVRFYLVSFPT
jgi:hypothetical protein